MSEIFKGACIVLAYFGLIYGSLVTFSERPETTGRTELSSATGTGGYHPGDNYAVFRKSRCIKIITEFVPVLICERGDKLVREITLLAQGRLPVNFYSSPAPAEEALWQHHFLNEK